MRDHPGLWSGTCALSQGHWGTTEGLRAGEEQDQTLAAFWRVDPRAVRLGSQTREEAGGPRNKEEPGSGHSLGEGEGSTDLRAFLEAEWNIRRGGCQPGWRWGRKPSRQGGLEGYGGGGA